MKLKHQPPSWANKFLEWYCNPQVLEEIQGDAFELFYRTSKESVTKAKWSFVWNVLRFFRWRNIRKDRIKNISPIHSAMYKNYLIMGLRSMKRNLIPSIINITGLSVALGCAIAIFIILDTMYHADLMHSKAENIYLIADQVKTGDDTEKKAGTPFLLGPALKDNSAVETVVRIHRTPGVSIRHKDNVFYEPVWFVDADILNVFDFPLREGNKNALQDKNTIMITQAMAEKYFGKTDPLGQTLSIKFSGSEKSEFTVGAVLENVPYNSSVRYQMFISINKLEDLDFKGNNWKTFVRSSFVLFKKGHGPQELETAMKEFKKIQNAADPISPIVSFEFIPLLDLSIRSQELDNSLFKGNPPAVNIAFALIGIFLLLLACFNYMNISIASVSIRLKEIGIRKVIGGNKPEIIKQFLTENFLACFIALAVGGLIAKFLLLPGFNSAVGTNYTFLFSSSYIMFGFLTGLVIFVALLSGAYPSIYVASFNPVKILRGNERFGNKSLLSRVLLTFQFILSFTTITGSLVFVWSGNYIERKGWGYNPNQTLVVPLQTPAQFVALKNRLVENKNVLYGAGSQNHIQYQTGSATVQNKDQNLKVACFNIGFGYVESLNLTLKEGRLFNPAIESDKRESIIVNESFVKKMNWKSALGMEVQLDSVKRNVIGVISDFYFDSFFGRIDPMVFRIVPEENFKYLVVKTEVGSVTEVNDYLRKLWKEIAPDDPYSGFFQSSVFDNDFQSQRNNNKILYFISFVTLLLAGMGLYGLISYNLTRRMKEFCVRKIFGAQLSSIFNLMNKDYVGILLIAFCIGAPAGYYLMNQVIKVGYPNESIQIGIWPFAITIMLMLVTTGATIYSQLKRVARENPTEILKND